MEVKKSIYFLDGFHAIFRAFYAVRPLATSKKLPTNASYGFLRMLLKVLKEEHPAYFAVFFDRPEPNFRNALYAPYKANRQAAPEDLVVQIDWIKRLVGDLDIPIIEKPSFEADDLMGTAAKHFEAEGYPVVIISGDKDLMQLVNDRITIWDSMKDLRIDREGVKLRFGVWPEQVIDILALAGDSSDNVPGVRGIGEKTAASLIAQYGSLDGVYANLDAIPGKKGELLREHRELAYLCKTLVTIDCHVPWNFSLQNFAVEPPQWDALRETLHQLEFTRVWTEIESIYGQAPSLPIAMEARIEEAVIASEADVAHTPQALYAAGGYRAIQTFEELAQLLQTLATVDLFSIDTETTGLNVLEAKLVGISLAWKAGEAVYIPIGHHTDAPQLPQAAVIQSLKPFLESDRFRKVGQNLKYDMHILKRHGLLLRGLYADTMIASYLLSPEERHNLDDLAEKYLSYTTIHFKDLIDKSNKAFTFSDVPLEKAVPYAAQDADVAYRLFCHFAPVIEAQGLHALFYDLEMPVCEILQEMESSGITVDSEKLKELARGYETQIAILEAKIHQDAGEVFNIQSPKQLGKILFEKLKLPVLRSTKTGPSTDSDVLDTLARVHNAAIADDLIAYRALCKLKSTYVDKLPLMVNARTGRLHTSFNQTITATGRLSSSEPNLQNIPIKGEEGFAIRQAFVAPPGQLLLSLDYSQIELRILAHLSQDPALLEVFRNHEDCHRRTASRIFGVSETAVTPAQRRIGKTVNFATLYGQGPYSLSEQLHISRAEAKHYIEQYFIEYKGVGEYRDALLAEALGKGYVTTYLGRRRYLPELASRNKTLQLAAERMAFNAVIQGSAADLMKLAMIRVAASCKRRHGECRLILQVHDELVLEVNESAIEAVARETQAIMQSVAPDIAVPLTVEYAWGHNWAQAHP